MLTTVVIEDSGGHARSDVVCAAVSADIAKHLRPTDRQEAPEWCRLDRIVFNGKGIDHGDAAAHFADVYGATVSKDTISRITDKVIGEMNEWSSRRLEWVYPVVFIDAIHVKIRDGHVAKVVADTTDS